MPFHTERSFHDVLSALPTGDQDENRGDLHAFREEVEGILSQLYDVHPKTLFESEFDRWASVAEPTSPEGGRPADSAMITALLALADVYQRRTSTDEDVSNFPASQAVTGTFFQST
ncbi:MAG: hypothetical protein V4671_12115, partial [Armatimonadota bacterium]